MNHLWNKDDSSPCIVYGKDWVLAELRQRKAAYYQDRGYTCRVCQRCYKTPEDLDNHVNSTTCSGYTAQQMEAFWEAEKPWKCPECRKSFRTEDDRDSHFDDVHKTDTRRQIEYQNKKPWPCSRCPRRFGTEDGKDAHESGCGKTPEEIASEYEAWIAEKKPFVCDFCDNRFETEKRKNDHQWNCGNIGAWSDWSGDNRRRDQAEEQPRSACTSESASERRAVDPAHQEALENMPLKCIDETFDPTCELCTVDVTDTDYPKGLAALWDPRRPLIGFAGMGIDKSSDTHTASAAEQDKLEEIQPDVMPMTCVAIQPDCLKDLKEIDDAEDWQIENAKVNAEVPRWAGSQSSSVLDAEWLGSQSSSVLDAEKHSITI